MTDITFAGGTPFRVGTCLSKALSAFFGNLVAFNVMGLAIMVPGFILIALFFGAVFWSALSIGSAGQADVQGFDSTMIVSALATIFIFIILQYLLTGVVVYGALQHLRGQKPSVGAALTQGLRRAGPIAIVAIITTILTWIGLILVIVPGIIIYLMLCVAVPVLMVEGPSIGASLSRSRELTKGQRLRLFGLLLVGVVGSGIVVVAIGTVIGLVLPESDVGQIVGAVVELALQLFSTVFVAVLLAVAYHDLRVAKEGVSTAQTAAVFD